MNSGSRQIITIGKHPLCLLDWGTIKHSGQFHLSPCVIPLGQAHGCRDENRPRHLSYEFVRLDFSNSQLHRGAPVFAVVHLADPVFRCGGQTAGESDDLRLPFKIISQIGCGHMPELKGLIGKANCKKQHHPSCQARGLEEKTGNRTNQ